MLIGLLGQVPDGALDELLERLLDALIEDGLPEDGLPEDGLPVDEFLEDDLPEGLGRWLADPWDAPEDFLRGAERAGWGVDPGVAAAAFAGVLLAAHECPLK